ncbi:MAG: hypothetical protein ACYC61_25325, partial [Isosphaeraceae bacterium]
MPEVNSPVDPALVLGALETTALGCAWLLDRWGELGALLEDGLLWQPPDRFKAIRLLGRQPLEATDDDRVLAIYLACHAMEPESANLNPFADIHIELQPGERLRFNERVVARTPPGQAPVDAQAGREVLLTLVAEQSERLEALLEAHLQREAAAEEARLGFEDTDDGERLRRYQLAAHRTLLRILEILRRRHREADRAASDRGQAASGKDGPDRSVRVSDPAEEPDRRAPAPASHAGGSAG